LWQEKFLRAAHLALRFFPPKLMDETKFPQKNPFPKVEMGIFIRILSATHYLFLGNESR
jgi:hypothetical protein